MDYTDVVRSISQAYWKVLLENDAEARASAERVAEQLGFQPNAADTMIEQFSRQPLEEWLAQRSATSPSSYQEG